ncbi:assembly of actin patch protein [Marasmius sp. AFHP31]|nr:assembly of actin patch protein [Marasmius sp. AFHP31]
MEDVEYEDAREQGKQEEVPSPPPPPPPPPRSSIQQQHPSTPASPPLPPEDLVSTGERESKYGGRTETWEIPEFGAGKEADSSLSSRDDVGIAARAGVALKPSSSQPQPQQTQVQQTQQTLTSDNFMALWRRVGVQVCEVATGLYEKSKRVLICDGSHRGFVDATLAQVLNAAATPDSYGYLIYHQTWLKTAQASFSWAMRLKDAKLEGHKRYTRHVGEGDEVCVVDVRQFEARKFRISMLGSGV